MGRKFILGLDLETNLGPCRLFLDGRIDAPTHKLESTIGGRTVGVARLLDAMRNLNGLAFALRSHSPANYPASRRSSRCWGLPSWLASLKGFPRHGTPGEAKDPRDRDGKRLYA